MVFNYHIKEISGFFLDGRIKIFTSKKSKQRFQDYAYKIGLKMLSKN